MIRHGVWSDCYLSADYLFIYFQNINSNTFVYYRLPAFFFFFPFFDQVPYTSALTPSALPKSLIILSTVFYDRQ